MSFSTSHVQILTSNMNYTKKLKGKICTVLSLIIVSWCKISAPTHYFGGNQSALNLVHSIRVDTVL